MPSKHESTTCPQNMKALLTLIFLSLGIAGIQNQASAQLYDVPISVLEEHATLVIEGVVRSKEAFWNERHNRIYTSYQIEVIDFLKGNDAMTLEVVALGGCVDDHCQTIYPGLEMNIGARGVLFLRPFRKEKLHSENLFEVLSGPLGFIEFSTEGGKTIGANALRVFRDLDFEVFVPISGQRRKVVGPLLAARSTTAPAIDSLAPLTVAAGVNDTLNIYGSQFGVSKGKVWFRNADKPAGAYMHGENPDIVTWSDTLIRVLVPSRGSIDSTYRGVAGTGPIRVETSDTLIAQSAMDIIVPYGLRNRRIMFDSIAQPDILVSPYNTPIGGYQFRYDSAFSDSSHAVAIFERSIRDWRCASLVNFSIGADSNISEIAFDEVNAIFWDTLPPGILGQTSVKDQFCRDGVTGKYYYHVTDIDLQFSSTINFYYDSLGLPPATHFDFYSMTLHELGHAHLLQHIVNPGFLMHYAISTGETIRTIHAEMETGAKRVIDSSAVNHHENCFMPHVPISPEACNSLGAANPSPNPFGSIQVFPNPAKTSVQIEFETSKPNASVSVEIVDIYGRVLSQKTMRSSPNVLSHIEFETAEFSNGFYFVRIHSTSGKSTKPFLIQH